MFHRDRQSRGQYGADQQMPAGRRIVHHHSIGGTLFGDADHAILIGDAGTILGTSGWRDRYHPAVRTAMQPQPRARRQLQRKIRPRRQQRDRGAAKNWVILERREIDRLGIVEHHVAGPAEREGGGTDLGIERQQDRILVGIGVGRQAHGGERIAGLGRGAGRLRRHRPRLCTRQGGGCLHG